MLWPSVMAIHAVGLNRVEARIGRCSMAVRLEHANLTVRDIDGMIRFLKTAFPEFRVRGEGKNRDGGRWVHVGTDQTYIALSPAKREPEQHWMPYQGAPGVNHLAYEVDDVEALCQRMMSAGYQDSTPPNAHPTASAGISTIRRATIGSSSSTSLRSPLSATITRCRIDRHVLAPESDEAGLKRNQKWGLRR